METTSGSESKSIVSHLDLVEPKAYGDARCRLSVSAQIARMGDSKHKQARRGDI